MEKANYVGRGWENQYGDIKVSIKKSDIESLPVNEYGDILLYIGKRKEVDEKSKATHYVKENRPKP